MVERLQSRIGVPDPVVADQANRHVLVREARRLDLILPSQFQPVRAIEAGGSLVQKVLFSRASAQLPLHPHWLTVLLLGVFVALFRAAL
ncbi:hypothetical protein [Novosphingobium sp. BW1]|uniref:hypothetical protein n=1 Tax=Novosphingobium sp. BW1 TaxID=2592621 RepID=UPI0011DE5D1E|nr:hypothetical protein [Novosphingobium sp. BW1]TYC86686.1 hypothetical protein FMM79_12370 [Novosphingobium sp. BW1]